ncbi:MAG TPA: hypothetical protein VIP09_12230 [Dehalococcoidia bacterium]
MAGRPSKLTPDVQGRVLAAISAGNTRATAAAYARVGLSTLMAWLARGEKATRGQYREFLDAVKNAEAAAVVTSVALVRQAASEHWQAAAWWLERRYPDEWGRKDRVAIEHVLREKADRIAEDTGLNAEDLVADAERILASFH